MAGSAYSPITYTGKGAMSYRPKRPGHFMSVIDILFGDTRYAACPVPGCMRVRRSWALKPLLHKGKAYRGR